MSLTVVKCALKNEMLIGMIAPCRECITPECEKTYIKPAQNGSSESEAVN